MRAALFLMQKPRSVWPDGSGNLDGAALNDLDAIADDIALENPDAARALVQKIFQHVEQLASIPRMGRKLLNSRFGVIVKLSSRPAEIFIGKMASAGR